MKYQIYGNNKSIRFETKYFVSVVKVNGRSGTTVLEIRKSDSESILNRAYESSDLTICFMDSAVHINILTSQDFIPELMEDLKKAGIKVEKR